jgi:hypothetical protein
VSHQYSHELAEALEALSLVFPDRLAWMGEPIQVGTGADARSALIDAITALLYSQFYCYGRPVALPTRDPGRQVLPTARLVDRLRKANREGPRWMRGWRIVCGSENGVRVSRGGLSMSVASAEDFRHTENAGEVEVRFSSESLTASPGFFAVQSPKALDPREPSVRLYWNNAPEGAVALVERVTELFRHTPYQLKVLTSFAQGERADASVLYLRREDLTRCAGGLSRIYDEVAEYLRAATPAFTLRLAPGLALAENPPDGESFGRNRCSLVAEALVEMSQAGEPMAVERFAQHFASRGLSLDRPYLGAGSQERYSLPVQAKIMMPPVGAAEFSDRDTFVDAAVRIGNRLVESAVWAGERCNWIAELTGGRNGYGALDPMLYSGTSGIAWFLAELYRICGEEAFRRTACGALEHSCREVETDVGRYGSGLYAGPAGVGYVAWRCASLLKRPALAEQSQQIFKRVLRTKNCLASDVMSGEAGVILALAAAGACESRMEFFGRALLASAKQTGNTLSWRTVNTKRSPNLTGFSHGTAGIASALLVLYEQTRDVEFRNGAEGAIRYERDCFSEADRNWPDYRSARNRRSPVSYTVAWCHGAPGIALSRALAVRVCGSETSYQRDLAAALDTTRAAVENFAPGTDFCLCHGIAGNTDILQLVGRREDRGLVQRAAAFIIDKCDPRERSGAFSQRPPGLMAGWAGVGQFYLRLADPSIPSPLWIGPSLEKVA